MSAEENEINEEGEFQEEFDIQQENESAFTLTIDTSCFLLVTK